MSSAEQEQEQFTPAELERAARAAKRLLGAGDEDELRARLLAGEPIVGGTYVLRKSLQLEPAMPSVKIKGVYFKLRFSTLEAVFDILAGTDAHISNCTFDYLP